MKPERFFPVAVKKNSRTNRINHTKEKVVTARDYQY